MERWRDGLRNDGREVALRGGHHQDRQELDRPRTLRTQIPSRVRAERGGQGLPGEHAGPRPRAQDGHSRGPAARVHPRQPGQGGRGEWLRVLIFTC